MDYLCLYYTYQIGPLIQSNNKVLCLFPLKFSSLDMIWFDAEKQKIWKTKVDLFLVGNNLLMTTWSKRLLDTENMLEWNRGGLYLNIFLRCKNVYFSHENIFFFQCKIFTISINIILEQYFECSNFFLRCAKHFRSGVFQLVHLRGEDSGSKTKFSFIHRIFRHKNLGHVSRTHIPV